MNGTLRNDVRGVLSHGTKRGSHGVGRNAHDRCDIPIVIPGNILELIGVPADPTQLLSETESMNVFDHVRETIRVSVPIKDLGEFVPQCTFSRVRSLISGCG